MVVETSSGPNDDSGRNCGMHTTTAIATGRYGSQISGRDGTRVAADSMCVVRELWSAASAKSNKPAIQPTSTMPPAS